MRSTYPPGNQHIPPCKKGKSSSRVTAGDMLLYVGYVSSLPVVNQRRVRFIFGCSSDRGIIHAHRLQIATAHHVTRSASQRHGGGCDDKTRSDSVTHGNASMWLSAGKSFTF